MQNTKIAERRNQLRSWLSRDGLTLKDFASQLGVSEASAYNWVSCTNIPDKRWKQIEDFFKKEDEIAKFEQLRVIGAAFSEEEMKLLEKAAKGQPLDLFFRECVLNKTKDLLKE